MASLQVTAARDDRAQRLIPIALVAIVLGVAISTVTPWPVGILEDDAIYTILGKSLAEGHGYRLINLPGAPNATHFPPVYPALLAVLWRAWPTFPDNVVLFKFANALLLALAAAGTYLFALHRLALKKSAAIMVALAGTASVLTLLLAGLVLSEPLFLALLAPTLFAAETAIDNGRARTAFVAGLLLGVLALVRTLGLFALPAALVLLVYKRRYAAAAALMVGAALLIVPWQLWVMLHQHEVPSVIAGKYGSYTGWAAQGYADGGVDFIWRVAVKNAAALFRLLSYVLMPVEPLWPRVLAFAAFIGLLLVGVRNLTRRAPVTMLFVLLYFAVVMVWPFEPDRFLLGLWPLLVMWATLGIQTGAHRRSTPSFTFAARFALIAVLLGLGGGFATYNGRGFQNSWWEPYQRKGGQRLKPIAEWVAHHTSMDDVVATDHDPAVYLYTGRRAVPTNTWMVHERVRPLTPDEDSRAVRQLLAELRPQYYVPTSVNGLRAARALEASTPPLLRYLGRTPNGFAFKSVRQ